VCNTVVAEGVNIMVTAQRARGAYLCYALNTAAASDAHTPVVAQKVHVVRPVCALRMVVARASSVVNMIAIAIRVLAVGLTSARLMVSLFLLFCSVLLYFF
jgi:hypothetical protein